MLSNCHGVMHTVGRTYALDEASTSATCRTCCRGATTRAVARGSPTASSQAWRRRSTRGGRARRARSARTPERGTDATAACTASGTRSCASTATACLRRSPLCRALGPGTAPDCAQGAYHDYWFAVAGADQAALPAGAATDPRTLCAAQPAEFVRPCWYRAFVDDRPEGIVVDSAIHLDVLCRELAGLQREACITGAAVIGPADPEEQLALCADLEDQRDAVACIRGTKAQNLLGASTAGLRAPRRPLRALRRRDEDRLLPVARQGGRRAHRRRLPARGCPLLERRGRPPRVCGGRP